LYFIIFIGGIKLNNTFYGNGKEGQNFVSVIATLGYLSALAGIIMAIVMWVKASKVKTVETYNSRH
jgi:hypothetical protein